MIPGWSMARRSSLTPAGIPSPGFIGAASALALVLDLVSAFSEDLGGAGATGDMTGTADERSSTITPSSHIAMSSVTRDSIMAISATVAPTAADSMGLRVFTGARASTEIPAFTRSRERALARSVASITAAMCEGFHLADGRVLEVAPMEAVSMVAADAIGNHMYQPVELIENS